MTENTPIEVFPDMDRQAKFKSQTANPFFDDTSSDRLPVEGTAIRGNLISIRNVFSEKPEFESDDIKFGKNSDGQWVSKIPNEVGIDMSLMRLKRNTTFIVLSAMVNTVMVKVNRLFWSTKKPLTHLFLDT